MPRVSPDYVPAYRLHKASQQAIVTLSGRDYTLGAFGSAESRVKYHQLVAQWLAAGRKPIHHLEPQPSPFAHSRPSVHSLVSAFNHHVESTYVARDGAPQTSAIAYIKRCAGFAAELFPRVTADDFTPSMAKECRERMVKAGWTRKGCNKGLRMIRMMFAWGVEHDMVKAEAWQALKAIKGLKAGRTAAPESVPVKPVADTAVEAIRPFVSRQVWAMIQLQRLTGARAGELVIIRPVDIDTSGDVWLYTPKHHKTQNYGHSRTLYMGPQARAVLRPFLENRTDLHAYLFDPREANAEVKADGAAIRRRPGQKANPRRTERRIGDHYTTASYRRAIHNACDAAGIDRWSPHRLRHAAATFWRKKFGPDAALIMLGDKSSNMVEVYAERDQQTAIKIAAEVG